MGSLSVQKTVYVRGEEYTVQLMISTPTDLTDFALIDPLPQGATVIAARPPLPPTLKAGQTDLIYRFSFPGEQRAAVTDPSASWRY